MKKGLLSLALVLASVAVVQAKGSKDPELMTINGKAVTLGEFEYLYHKNNSQQLAPQTIDEYLDMFVTYKQKVADAESEGIDNTEAFKNEFDGYRRELAEPYLRNKEMEDSIIRAVYSHMQEDVDVSHIMLASKGPELMPKPRSTPSIQSARQFSTALISRHSPANILSTAQPGKTVAAWASSRWVVCLTLSRMPPITPKPVRSHLLLRLLSDSISLK